MRTSDHVAALNEQMPSAAELIKPESFQDGRGVKGT